MALQPDGKILVAGYGGSNTAMTVTRLNPDGSLDNSFDGDGTAGVDLGGPTSPMRSPCSPTARSSSSARRRLPAEAANVAVVRLNPDGSPDPGFNGTAYG